MSTSKNGGATTTRRVKLSKCTTTELYKALIAVHNHFRYRTVRNDAKKPFPVPQIAEMAYGYVVQASDTRKTDKDGFQNIRNFQPTELLNTRNFWESRGIRKGMLPNIVKTDPHSGNEIECYMTMNGIPIDPNAEAVASKLRAMILFPGSVTLEALGIIEEALNMYIDDEGRTRRNQEGPYGVIERLQQAHIMLQNALFADRQKIADKIKETTGKLVKK